jgi:hypothetical protein
MMKPSSPRRRHLPNSPFQVPRAVAPIETFHPEDRVTHDQYGLGRVIDVEGDIAVLVQCGNHRVRVTSPFSKLYKL